MGGSPFCALFPVQSVFEWGEADNPKAAGSNPKSWRFPPVRREDLLTAFWGSANQKSLRDGRRPTAAYAVCRYDPSCEKVNQKNPQIFLIYKLKIKFPLNMARV